MCSVRISEPGPNAVTSSAGAVATSGSGCRSSDDAHAAIAIAASKAKNFLISASVAHQVGVRQAAVG